MTAPRAAEVVAEDVLGSPQDADPERPWHRPGVYAVAPGVFRIPLPLPDPGMHSVNAYIIDGPDGLVLIDPGQATSASREHLLHGLEMLGRSPRDVRRSLVTHVHRDHYTQAVALRRGGDHAVALGRQERRSLALVADPACDVIGTQLGLLVECGAAELARQVAGADDGVARDLWEEPDTWLEEGGIDLGTRVLDTIPTPGTRAVTWCSATRRPGCCSPETTFCLTSHPPSASNPTCLPFRCATTFAHWSWSAH